MAEVSDAIAFCVEHGFSRFFGFYRWIVVEKQAWMLHSILCTRNLALSSRPSVENRKRAEYNQVVLFAGQKPNRVQRKFAGDSGLHSDGEAAGRCSEQRRS
jgi:hypothetical protein